MAALVALVAPPGAAKIGFDHDRWYFYTDTNISEVPPLPRKASRVILNNNNISAIGASLSCVETGPAVNGLTVTLECQLCCFV